jgi:ABC-2 type transport system permease protein
MSALLVSVQREFRLIFRNGISIFMVAAPAILALVFILVFGSVNNTSLNLAIDGSVSAAQEEKLSRVADMVRYDDAIAVEARVRETDALAGVVVTEGTVRIFVEGNEGEMFAEAAAEIVGLALGAEGAIMPYESESIVAKGTMAYHVSMISMLLLSLFIGGATVGLSIVDEREGGAIRAVTVSPMRLSLFAATKLLPALLLGLFGMAAAAFIIGKAALVPQYLLLALCSVFVSGMMTFAIGAFASNQVAAIGVLKILVPVSMILPVSAMFVPQQWQFAFFPLPMYWQYRALSAILSGEGALLYMLLTLLVGVPWFAGALWLFCKRTNFRNTNSKKGR